VVPKHRKLGRMLHQSFTAYNVSDLCSLQSFTKDHVTDKIMLGCCKIRCHCDASAVRYALKNAVDAVRCTLVAFDK
jgi:hypothetical protein